MSFEAVRLTEEARAEIAGCADAVALEALRIKYVGRRGIVADLMSRIPTLPEGERRAYGGAVNALKNQLLELVASRERALKAAAASSGGAFFDTTLPGKAPLVGRLHPLTQVQTEICGIFQRLGFKIFEGPEVETEHNNFEALNIPLDHPSRDAFDTFYIKKSPSHQDTRSPEEREGRLLLRSHTSPAQIRAMKAHKPPLAILVPGRVFRPDAVDASHSFMFHQIEGFAVGETLGFSGLKGILLAFCREMFTDKTRLRFRPSFFPFTEPSAEVDISCILCSGRGCGVCKKSGWLEILGCGMIHPRVFKSVGYDTRRWRGFAFGMGVERIAMLKFRISDIRMFFENDLRFLEQF